jgi:hypothetical protein
MGLLKLAATATKVVAAKGLWLTASNSKIRQKRDEMFLNIK